MSDSVASTGVVIPAAGMGRRLKTRGPKALLQVGTETVLERQLRLLGRLLPSPSAMVVVSGFEAERIRSQVPAGVSVVFNPDYGETNVATSIGMGLSHCPPGPVLVVYGDLVFGSGLLSCLAGLTESAVVAERSPARQHEVGVVQVNGQATWFAYGLPLRWAQVVLLQARERALFEELATQEASRRLFGFELLNQVLDRGGRFRVLESPHPLAEIDCAGDIRSACALAMSD